MGECDQIEPNRIRERNDAPINPEGQYVLYWMQQSQRAEDNPALEYAVERANELGKPLLVGFGLMDGYPEANLRHYTFMLEGLADTAAQLARRGIRLVVRNGAPAQVAIALGKEACLIVCDYGYLRHQEAWRGEVAAASRCLVVAVEGDVIVPVAVASDKEEFAARTLRPKITRQFGNYLRTIKPRRVTCPSMDLRVPGLDLTDVGLICESLKLDRSVQPVSALFRGGGTEAKRVFREFLNRRFSSYAEHRNHPETDDVSHMSKYLHFGQVSCVWLAREARAVTGISDLNIRTFIEELLVRRELAINYVHYNARYDHYEGLPDWAKATLAQHGRDRRPVLYSPEELEAARTHDPYWNAAMIEMRATGYMHNYMRMYWGKKVVEWSPTPQEAFETLLALNNKYFLDGRDPLSYANVAWVLGKHDRPFTEREIFGKVRWMSAGGLERKCDIRGYVTKVKYLESRVGLQR